jgi:two-component system sensor kinase FixL
MEQTLAVLQAIYRSVGQGIITIDDDSTILIANQHIIDAWGYSAEELIGKSVTMLMAERYRERNMAGLKCYAHTRAGDAIGQWLEVEGLKKDGTIFPLEIRIEETQIGDRLAFAAAVREHSEHNRIIQAARSNQKRLHE